MNYEYLEKVLCSKQDIETRCAELGNELSNKFVGSTPLVVGLLKGAVPFMAELIKHFEIDIEIDFMDVSSYGNSFESSGEVRINKDLDVSVANREVIVVEDIIDTGRTLKIVKDLLVSRGAKSVTLVTLLDKKERRVVDIDPDYSGFLIPNEFVIGFGLDYKQIYRNLPFVGVLKEEFYKE